MKIIAVEKTDLSLKAALALAKKEPVIVTRNGKPLASVKSLSGSDWESVSLANNPQFLAIIEKSRRSLKKDGGLTLDQVRQELGLRPSRRRRKLDGKK